MTGKETRRLKPNEHKGIPASSGIVIGKVYLIDRDNFCVLKHELRPDEIDTEIEKFKAALDTSLMEMSEIKDQALREFDDELPFTIFDAHTQILRDPSMAKEVERIIRDSRCNAEWALNILLKGYHARFSNIKDKYFRDRLQDIDQVVTKVLRSLVQGEDAPFSNLDEPVVLVAHDLSPADTLSLNQDMVIGIATDAGGKTSHAGILASSMDIPAVVGLKDVSRKVSTGDPVVVDGNAGIVVTMPTNEQFMEYNTRRQKYVYYDQALHAQKDLEAITLDGERVAIRANIESSHDLVHLEEHGAEGVGLYRTEYLFLNSSSLPDERAQYEDYKKVAEAVGKNHAVIRTFDLGGDKVGKYMDYADPEPNPALGLRAIRFCLSHPDIFKTQLRAILRASAHGNLKIMYPLLTSLEELIRANELLAEAKEELRKSGDPFDESIPVGIMIETPSSVMIAPELARHCSFFSIGTNDLIQYAMAIDRVNERVAYLYQPLSPSILRMLAMIVRAADEAEVSLSICGKMAGDPTYVMLLMGLGGVRDLSMDVHSIPRIKKFIRSIKLKEAQTIASHAISLGSTEQIKEYVVSQVGRFFVDGVSSDLVENDG